jgi:hypothetical protein
MLQFGTTLLQDCDLGCGSLWLCRRLLTFRRNLLPFSHCYNSRLSWQNSVPLIRDICSVRTLFWEIKRLTTSPCCLCMTPHFFRLMRTLSSLCVYVCPQVFFFSFSVPPFLYERKAYDWLLSENLVSLSSLCWKIERRLMRSACCLYVCVYAVRVI